MELTTNTRVVLTSRPVGAPVPANFRVETGPVPRPGEGQALLRTIYLSLDPYLRGRMGTGMAFSSTVPPMALDSVVPGGTVCEVVESRHPSLAPGDIVLGAVGWQEFGVQDASLVRPLDPTVAPISTALGVLGMPGLTAYAGLHAIGKPLPGETVVVAAATGPVGSLVGQMAKIGGARVIGIAGGPEKLAWLRESGFDFVIDHRSADFVEKLSEATPDGIDVYFENVGGRVFDAVLPRLNPSARVPVCGLIANYNGPQGESAFDVPALMSAVLSRQITVQGYAFTSYVDPLQDEFLERTAEWIRSGLVRYREDIVVGLESAPGAFASLFEGANFGKLLVKVSADPSSDDKRGLVDNVSA